MSREIRSSAVRSLKELGFTGSGPYEAIVVSHLDPGYMGTLKVDLLRKNKAGSLPERVGTSIEVKYLSPFYGVTNYNNTTKNDGYENTQKSYGMWMVPPDSGSKVLVIFAEGDISRGYWIGCIQDQFMNFMVPDGRASTELSTDGTPGKFSGKKVPVGEYNKRTETGETKDPTRFKKPYNKDFTESLDKQGLIDDEVRGTTTSSARREVPSSVFGISTPGPIDKRAGAPRGEYGEAQSKADVFVNRLGGSSFVMDDGDDKFLRKSPPNFGPPEYASVEAGELDGIPDLPQNELMRFRTRTGHQILLHNTEDLIYIGNSGGTSWIELTSNGKVDIYAKDSVSIHSDQDLNFTADRDLNFEAGRNINVRAQGRDDIGGNIQIESKGDTNVLVETSMKVDIAEYSDTIVGKTHKFAAGEDSHIDITGGLYTTTTEGINLKTSKAININAEEVINIKTLGDINIQSDEGSLNARAGMVLSMYGDKGINALAGGIVAIDGTAVAVMGGVSTPAGLAYPAEIARTAESFDPLLLHELEQIDASSLNKYTLMSITKRMPCHEPYPHHENLNPEGFLPHVTDVTDPNPVSGAMLVLTPDTFRKADGENSRDIGLSRTRTPGSSSNLSGNPNTGIDGGLGSSPSDGSDGNTPGPVSPTDPRRPGQSSGSGITDPKGIPTKNVTGAPSDLVEYIKEKEGFRAEAYWDVNQYSIGYGTKAKSSTEVITQQEAEIRLRDDLAERRRYVTSYAAEKNYNWSSDQIDSLTSFSHNLGTGAIDQVTNNGTRSNAEIASKMPLYNKAGGRTLPGLVSRRNEESNWFSRDLG